MKNFEQFEMTPNEVNKVEGGFSFNFFSSTPTSYSSVRINAFASPSANVSYSFSVSSGGRTFSFFR